MKGKAFCAALSFISTAAAAQPPTTEGAWHCRFTEGLVCSPGQACESERVGGVTILYPANRTYMLCRSDLTNCRDYEAHYSNGNSSVLIDVPGWNVFGTLTSDLKLTTANAIGHVVHIQRGACQVGPPPLVTLRQARPAN